MLLSGCSTRPRVASDERRTHARLKGQSRAKKNRVDICSSGSERISVALQSRAFAHRGVVFGRPRVGRQQCTLRNTTVREEVS